jgi:hypothetical protein
MFLYSLNNMTTLRHLSYQWEDDTIDNATFCVFPKRVILKEKQQEPAIYEKCMSTLLRKAYIIKISIIFF